MQRPLRGPPATALAGGGRGDIDSVLAQHTTDRLDPNTCLWSSMSAIRTGMVVEPRREALSS